MTMYIKTLDNSCNGFQGRCVHIRDAQWVCHKVNTVYPHMSLTKFNPMFIKQFNKLERHNRNGEKTTIKTFGYLKFVELGLTTEDLSSMTFLQQIKIKLKNLLIYSEEDKHVLQILKKVKEKIEDFCDKKMRCIKNNDMILSALFLMKKYKLGNCAESSRVAEFILKINGVKNATTLMLKAEKQNCNLDHAICVFNRDGSEFSSITKDTIVVDPWLDKADFAHNMISFYKNQCRHLIYMPEGQDIGLFDPRENNPIPMGVKKLRKKYPELVFYNPKRKFMCNP